MRFAIIYFMLVKLVAQHLDTKLLYIFIRICFCTPILPVDRTFNFSLVCRTLLIRLSVRLYRSFQNITIRQIIIEVGSVDF